jgi:hypothetical protein
MHGGWVPACLFRTVLVCCFFLLSPGAGVPCVPAPSCAFGGPVSRAPAQAKRAIAERAGAASNRAAPRYVISLLVGVVHFGRLCVAVRGPGEVAKCCWEGAMRRCGDLRCAPGLFVLRAHPRWRSPLSSYKRMQKWTQKLDFLIRHF